MLGSYKINEIHLADSYKAIKELPDNSIDCIYTDIPYLYDSGGGGESKLAKRIVVYNKSLRDLEIVKGIDIEILAEFVRVMKKINVFIWCSKLQILDIMNWFNENTKCNFEILTWCKSNPTPATNNVWLPDVEYCLYFREAGVILNDGYFLKSKFYSSPLNKSDKDLFKHPTIKPFDLVTRHLKHVTQVGDVILDPFVGSGTTAVAAKEIDRNFVAFEIDEEYHKIAVNRVNGITANGQTSIFTDMIIGEANE